MRKNLHVTSRLNSQKIGKQPSESPSSSLPRYPVADVPARLARIQGIELFELTSCPISLLNQPTNWDTSELVKLHHLNHCLHSQMDQQPPYRRRKKNNYSSFVTNDSRFLKSCSILQLSVRIHFCRSLKAARH